jgi:hypothetical protein
MCEGFIVGPRKELEGAGPETKLKGGEEHEAPEEQDGRVTEKTGKHMGVGVRK